jgi:hypothetical protein
MGASKSKVSDFFINNLSGLEKFKYTMANGETILFSLQDYEPDQWIDIHAEILGKPTGSSRVTIRCDSNCDQKSDKAKYIPDIKFRIYSDKEGFHEIVYKDSTLESILSELEREIIG